VLACHATEVADYRRHRVLWSLLVGLAAVAGCARPLDPGPPGDHPGGPPDPPGPALTSVTGPAGEGGPVRVLLFSRTLGFRHASIPVAVGALRREGARQGMVVDHTEDPARFTASRLRRYRVVVFLSTTGDVLDQDGEAALRGFVEAGGGWVGVHAAADTEDDWPWYETLVGARFARHPAVQRASVRVADRDHPATARLPADWARTDEWYDFRTNPRGRVRVLATLDESTYRGGGIGADHPIAWCQGGGSRSASPVGGGRAFYTAGGHTAASWAEARFLAHVVAALRWAAGEAEGDCRPRPGG
jgi:type 1 glutamine amidotransferase